MDVNAGAEKTNVKVEHLAAALGPRVHKEPVPKNLLHLQDLLHQSKGKSVFEAVVAKDDADIYVNFTEMRQIIDSEKKPGVTSDEQQPERWQRLNKTLNIYDKLLNGRIEDLGKDKDGSPDMGERTMVLRVLGDIPGFAESLAISTNGKMSLEQVRNCLMTGKAFPAEFRKTAAEMIGSFVGSPELRRRMEKALSTLALPEDDLVTVQELEQKKNEAQGKDILLQKRKDNLDVIEKYKRLNPDERRMAESLKNALDTHLNRLPDKYKMLVPESSIVSSHLRSVSTSLETKNARIQELTNEINTALGGGTAQRTNVVDNPRNQRDRLQNEVEELQEVRLNLEKVQEILTNEQATALFKLQKDFATAEQNITTLNGDIAQKEAAERKVSELEAKRNKYADKYKRKVERTLSEEMKKYWNEVKMEDAAEAAEAEAAEKKKLEAEAKTEAEKRAQIMEEMLNRYLRLSFMKYKGGKVVGWDDKAIKDFMHKDMLSQSPAQLARTFLEKIDDMSEIMPPQYQVEIAKMFKEMGVGKGQPPLTITKLLDEVDQKVYEGFAAKKVPDILGYAWARGYYFDRMKLTPHEAEFIKEAYKDPEFFKAAIASREKQIKLASELLQDNILSSGLTPELAKKIFGQDWTKGLNRLMKVLAVGAGAYVLGGGLVFDATGKYLGLQKFGETLGNTLSAGGAIAGAVSRAGDWAINAPLQGIDSLLSGTPDDVNAAGQVVTPGRPPLPPIRP